MRRLPLFLAGLLVVLVLMVALGGGFLGESRSEERRGTEASTPLDAVPAPRRADAAVVADQGSARQSGEARGGRAAVQIPAETAKNSDARVRGRVLASETGQPLAGAKLYLDRGARGFMFNVDVDAAPAAPRAVTGADGSFEIAAVEAGVPWDLRVEAPTRRPQRLSLGRLGAGESREAGDLLLELGATVEGRVLDAAGLPVEGALVHAERPPSEGTAVLFASAVGLPGSADVKTDREGRYRLDGLAPEEAHVVVAEADGRLPARSAPTKARVDTPTWVADLVLKDGKEITGRVVKRDGAPVEGALVSVRARGRGFVGDPWREMRRAKPLLTDREGRFRSTGLDDREVEIYVKAEGVGAARKRNVEPGTRDLVIELEPLGTIRGRLVPAPGVDPAELAGAFRSFEVFAERSADRPGLGSLSFSEAEVDTQCEENGSFEIAGLGKGKFRVHALGEAFASAVSELIDITPGRVVENLEIAVHPGQALDVLVVRAGTDEPVEGARVRVKEVRDDESDLAMSIGAPDDDGFDEEVMPSGGPVRTSRRVTVSFATAPAGTTGGRAGRAPLPPRALGGGGQPTPFQRTLQTGSDGRVRFTGLPEGRFEVRARRLDLAPSETETVTLGPAVKGEAAPLHVLEMSAGGHLEGRVLRGGTTPAAGATVELTGPEPYATRRSMTADGNGVYRFEHLTPGKYHAHVETRRSEVLRFDEAPSSGVAVAIVEGKTATLDLTAPVAVSVVGMVTQAGAPAAGVRVSAHPVRDAALGLEIPDVDFDFGGTQSATTGADGKFRIDGLDAGRYRFKARKPGSAKPSVKEIDVQTEGQRVDLTLPRGVVEGRVVRAAGSEGVAGATVSLVDAGERESAVGIMMALSTDAGGGEVMTFDGQSTVKTDSEGRFRLEDVPAGKYRVRARAAGLREAKTEPFDLGEDAALKGVDLKMEKAAVLLGRVLGPGGAPRSGAMVTLESVKGQGGPMPPNLKLTDSEGRYRFDSLNPGEYRVHAQVFGDGGGAIAFGGEAKGVLVTLEGGVETTKDLVVDK